VKHDETNPSFSADGLRVDFDESHLLKVWDLVRQMKPAVFHVEASANH